MEGPEGIHRRTCVFTGWPDYEEEPSDYAQNDGVVETGILNPQREPTPLPGWAKALELLPFEERSARFAHEYWCDVDTLNDYIGPTGALINDTRTIYDSQQYSVGGNAFRPHAPVDGASNGKHPRLYARGVGRAAQLTPKGLCIQVRS